MAQMQHWLRLAFSFDVWVGKRYREEALIVLERHAKKHAAPSRGQAPGDAPIIGGTDHEGPDMPSRPPHPGLPQTYPTARSAPVTPQMLDEIQFCIEYYWSTRGYCDHTHHNTRGWLNAHLPRDEVDAAIAYLVQLGGRCDCEVYTRLRSDALPQEIASGDDPNGRSPGGS